MRIGVLTSLFPSPPRPREGIFAERRWLGMLQRGHEVGIVQPTPRVPWPLGWLAKQRYGELAARPPREQRSGLGVERPRYVHLSGRSRGNAQRFVRAGLGVLLEQRPEVVVCDYAWPASAAAPRLRGAGIGCVVSGRGSDVLEVAGEAGLAQELAANLRAAGAWCAVSEDLVRAMDKLAGEALGVLVPNGVDAELFRVPTASQREQLRAELRLGPDQRLVLVVGHLIERKDPRLALASFAELARERPELRLLFVGKGPLEAALREDARRLGLEGRVELRSEVDPQQLAKLYAAADALLLTSRREGRPNVVLEALSSGLAVVATDAGGTRELLARSSLAVQTERRPESLAQALAAALEAPPARELLAASVADLTWESSLSKLEDLLEGAPR